MAGVTVDGIPELSMKTERATILDTGGGFGHYNLAEGGARARHLGSAYEVLANADEIWEHNPNSKTAQWVYIKEFDSKPYPFSIALVGESHTRSTVIVPFSSFPVRPKNIKKWRQANRIYP